VAQVLAEAVERWQQQARKGATRLAVLQLVSERERYGYDIVATISGRTRGLLALPEGNVYPALHALEREGALVGAWRETDEPGVPARKYYRLTQAGRALHAALVSAWKDHAQAIEDLLGGNEKP
jgi:PadR family transcriptional regulator PadR